MKLRAVSVVGVALGLSFAATGCDLDWQMRLGGIEHASTTSDAGLTATAVAQLAAKWRVTDSGCAGSGAGGFWATPVTFKGVVYVGGTSGCLYAINQSDGSRRWSRFMGHLPALTCGAAGMYSSANVQDDGNGRPVVYVHAPDGYLYKLDGTNGLVLWKSVVQIPSTTVSDVLAWSSPSVANGRVIVGVSSQCDRPFVQGQVRAYDAATGTLLWVHKTMPDGYTGAGDWYDAAVDSKGDVYVTTGSTDTAVSDAHPNTEDGFEEYSLLKLSGTTGALMWKAPAPVLALFDPDYASSPILFAGNGVGLVGATNKDGIFRVYRQDSGTEVWQARVGTFESGGQFAALSGAVYDGTHLFVMGNATTTGGAWKQDATGTWTEAGGTSTPGSIRALDPATGNVIRIGGPRFEVPLPSNPLGPCSLNANALLVCPGADWLAPLDGHDNGLFIVDTTKPPAVLRHLEDTANYREFGQPIQVDGAILAANVHELVKWAP
jgi:outer membrane protein assembly factor BamB